MTVGEVGGVLESDVSTVRRAVMFWVLHGVLKEVEPDTFAVLEQAETSGPNQSPPPSHEKTDFRYPIVIDVSPLKHPICRRTARI
jgi:hypothetical protein